MLTSCEGVAACAWSAPCQGYQRSAHTRNVCGCDKRSGFGQARLSARKGANKIIPLSKAEGVAFAAELGVGDNVPERAQAQHQTQTTPLAEKSHIDSL